MSRNCGRSAILHLRLFGSVARGDSSAQSDVDIMADFDRSKRLTLFDMARLEDRLSDLLGEKVIFLLPTP